MVTVLITSFLLLAVVSFAIYRWQRIASNDNGSQSLPPAPDFEGLFADSIEEEQLRLNAEQSETELKEKRKELFGRAKDGDKSSLLEAHAYGDKKFYDEVLDALVQFAPNEKQVFALASYVSRSGKLRVNKSLANAFTESWKCSPNRQTTAQMLHVAAMTGDASVYHKAVELVQLIRIEGKLPDIAPEELTQLIESEYWLLPSDARNSGAGFLLKRELAKVRRELAAHEKLDR
jgi:hypothetical protein